MQTILPFPLLLQEYARARILAFNTQPQLAQALGVTPATLRSATLAVLASTAPGPRARGRLRLTFRHDCQHPGCAEAHCTLCRQSQSRKCGRTFAHKYLAAADILKASCGAPIRWGLLRSWFCTEQRMRARKGSAPLKYCGGTGPGHSALPWVGHAPAAAS